MLKPVTPVAPKTLNRNPPTSAPMTPSTISMITPEPVWLTILLAMNPAIRPRTSHAIMPIRQTPFFAAERSVRPSLGNAEGGFRVQYQALLPATDAGVEP